MRGDKIPFNSLQIGDRILLRFDKSNPNNRTYHVRGFVDGRIILTFWSRRWKSYTYQIETNYWWKINSQYCSVRKGKQHV